MKKYSFYLTAALSLFIHGTACNLAASGQEIVVEFDPKIAIVKTFEQPKYGFTNNFQWEMISKTQKVLVEPINQDTLINVSSEGKNKIVITKENGTFLNTNLISEKILNVEEKKKPLQAKGDITHLSVIDYKEALFRFHNDGYLHTASSHGYVNCCFESEKKGAGVTLSGKSSQLDQSTPTTFSEILSKNISQEINNNLQNPSSFHQPITNDSFIKEIFVTAHKDRFVPVTCYVKFIQGFELYSAWQNASLIFTPNANFSMKVEPLKN